MTLPLFLTLALRYSTRHMLQTLLLILGVALGVALIVGVDLANQSAHEAFVLSTGNIGRQATHQIVADSGGLPTSLYETLRLELGLRQSAPVITGRVRLKNARNAYLQLIGIDPAAELALTNNLGQKDERMSVAALAHFLLTRDGVALSRTLSEQYNLAVGDILTVVANGQHKQVRLAVLLETENELSRRALDGMLLGDISTAQQVLGQPGRIDYIDLILPPGADPQPIIDLLPPNARLQPAGLRTQAVQQMVGSFELTLAMVSGLALLAGMFLIYNTVSLSVVQRRPLWGILRCLGVTRREILGVVLDEALLWGGLGSLIGVGLGVVLGRELMELVAGTMGEFYRLTVQRGFVLTPLTFYKGLAAGLVASLAAAVVPAVEATTIPPYSALQRSGHEQRTRRVVPWLALAGFLLLVVGLAGVRYPSPSDYVGLAALLAVWAGAVLLTPPVVRLWAGGVTPVTGRLFGVIGRLAPRDISRALSRTAVAVGALMLVSAILVAIGLIVVSFRQAMTAWVEQALQADIYVLPLDRNALPPSIVDDLNQAAGVARVRPVWESVVNSAQAGPVTVRAFDAAPDDEKIPFLWRNGDLAGLEAGDVVVSEAFASYHHLPFDQPSTLTLHTDRGLRSFRVTGVFYDYEAPGPGYMVMRPHIYQSHWQHQRLARVFVYLRPDLAGQIEPARQSLEQQLAPHYATLLLPAREIKTSLLAGLERSFTVISVLRALVAVVGFIGIFSALMSLQLERGHELGILRANGLTLPQLWAKTMLETGLMGLLAGLLAIPVGIIGALAILQLVNQQFLGWMVRLYFDPSILMSAPALALGAALLSGLYPAFRLSRMQVAAAIREE